MPHLPVIEPALLSKQDICVWERVWQRKSAGELQEAEGREERGGGVYQDELSQKAEEQSQTPIGRLSHSTCT